MKIKILPQQIGLRLDQFLKKTSDQKFSLKQWQQHIEAGSCSINGKIQFKSSYKVKVTDQIEFKISKAKGIKKTKTPQVLWFDNDFLVIDKPTQIALGNDQELTQLKQELKGFDELHLAHRLDKATSGVLLLARNAQALAAGMELFRQRLCRKTYLAIVQGCWKNTQGRITTLHGRKRKTKGQYLWGSTPKGQEAITDYAILKKQDSISLVAFQPLTGRTHQLRVHAAEGDHPILGDPLYGKNKQTLKTKRLMLHAWKLEFAHPFTNKEIKIEAPCPKEFDELIKWKPQI